MNKLFNQSMIAGIFALLLLSITSCGDSLNHMLSKNPLSIESVSKTGDIRVIDKDGDAFFLKISTPSKWTISVEPENAKEWVQLNATYGDSAAENKDIRVDIKANTSDKDRQAKIVLASNSDFLVLTLAQKGNAVSSDPSTPSVEDDDNTAPKGGGESQGGDSQEGSSEQGGEQKGDETNPETQPDPKPTPAGEHILGDPNMLEIPRLAGGKNHYFITHRTSDGNVNYSLEYNVDKRHSTWVAFQFNSENRGDHTKRTNAWDWDPKVPRSFSTERYFSGSGYSRGHLVASHDRLQSREANKQTFYYTNMSPQLQPHNGGIWLKQEQIVQSWGRGGKFQELYVAKGGTIRDDQIKSRRIKGKMVIPEYYWMAIVGKTKKGDYHGIAFWTEHRKYDKRTSLESVSLSIDDLEKKTGFDFFHNFPDDIESRFERENASSFNWPGL